MSGERERERERDGVTPLAEAMRKICESRPPCEPGPAKPERELKPPDAWTADIIW